MKPTRRRHLTTSALTSTVSLILVLSAACQTERDTPTLDFGSGELKLAMTDPGLIAEAGSYLGAAYFADGDSLGCLELLRMTTAELATYRSELVQGDVALAATQAWPADPIANRTDPFNPEPSTHTFGALRGWGKYAFVVLASRLVKHYESGDYPFGEAGAAADDLAFASGTVFAMGCTEAQVIPGERLDIRVVLYPAGMR